MDRLIWPQSANSQEIFSRYLHPSLPEESQRILLPDLSKRKRCFHNGSKERGCVTRMQAYADYAPQWAQTQSPPRRNDRNQQYIFWTTERQKVVATVEKTHDGYNITVSLPNFGRYNDNLYLQWGMFRTSSEKWFNPDEVSAYESSSVPSGGKGVTVRPNKQREGKHIAKFWVPSKLAPLYLAFKLWSSAENGEKVISPSKGGPHYAVPLGLGQSNPLLLGASMGPISSDGQSRTVNFAVNSRNATQMSLCIARRKPDGKCGGYLEIALDPGVNRKGDAWNASLDGLRDLETLCYGWRADADIKWDMGNRFHPGQVMLDPYAQIATKVYLPEGVNVPPPSKGLEVEASSDPQSNPPAYLGSLSALRLDFDWRDTIQPKTPLEKTVVLELDVARFSQDKDQVSQDHQGKYLGVIDRIPEMKMAGVTAVMLTPITLSGEGLGPFGRAPFSFFAPEPSLASSNEPIQATDELKLLIRELHSENIEVYFQVAYSLTGEGWNDSASAVSLRGLDAAVYYRAKGVLNCGHALVRNLILASLRHWLREFRVDGFCFLHAETLALDRDGNVLDNPPLAEDIAHDSELRQVKLVAWSGDDSLLPRQGQRGFPHWAVWQERNKRFTHHFNQFFQDHRPSDIASSLATRICGSADLFGLDTSSGFPGTLATARRPTFGLNSPSVYDSKPLDKTVQEILASHAPEEHHETLKRSLLFATFMSGGTPLIGADVLDDPKLTEFAGLLALLRDQLRHQLFPVTFDADWQINWYGAHPGVQPDWDGQMAAYNTPAAAYLSYTVYDKNGRGVYIAYNPYEGPVPAVLPGPPQGSIWKRAVDTGDNTNPALFESEFIPLSSAEYTVSANGAILLVSDTQPMQTQYRTQSQPRYSSFDREVDDSPSNQYRSIF